MNDKFTIEGVTYTANEAGTHFYKTTGAVDKKGNPITMRIGRKVYEEAFEQYKQTETYYWEQYEAEKQAEQEAKEANRAEQIKKQGYATESTFDGDTTSYFLYLADGTRKGFWNFEDMQAEIEKLGLNKKPAKKPSKPRTKAVFEKEINGQQVRLTEKQATFIMMMPDDDFYEHGLDSALWIDVYCDTVAGTFNPMAVGAMVSTLREKGLMQVGVDKINGKKCKFMEFTALGKEVAFELGLK